MSNIYQTYPKNIQAMTSRKTERQVEPAKDIYGRNIKHYRAPKYAPFGDYHRPVLYKSACKPRDLLNYTVAAFHNRSDVDLSEKQLEARKAFVNHFKKRKTAYETKVWPAASLKSFKDDVLEFFKYIDDFFFFGLLRDEVQIESGLDLDVLENRYLGMTSSCTVYEHTFIRIDMNIGTNGCLYQLSDIIGILMHEMVHAYLWIFACDCLRCDRDAPNTVGIEVDGHGPIFLMLHRLILTEIRRWGFIGGDNDLTLLNAADCPGHSMSLSAREQARLAIANMHEIRMFRYNQVRRQQNPNYLIRFSSNGDEVVVAQSLLRDGQIKMEKYLRSQWGDGKGIESKLTSTQDEPKWEIEDYEDDDSPYLPSWVPW